MKYAKLTVPLPKYFAENNILFYKKTAFKSESGKWGFNDKA